VYGSILLCARLCVLVSHCVSVSLCLCVTVSVCVLVCRSVCLCVCVCLWVCFNGTSLVRIGTLSLCLSLSLSLCGDTSTRMFVVHDELQFVFMLTTCLNIHIVELGSTRKKFHHSAICLHTSSRRDSLVAKHGSQKTPGALPSALVLT
jgi:hypothetical protein